MAGIFLAAAPALRGIELFAFAGGVVPTYLFFLIGVESSLVFCYLSLKVGSLIVFRFGDVDLPTATGFYIGLRCYVSLVLFAFTPLYVLEVILLLSGC